MRGVGISFGIGFNRQRKATDLLYVLLQFARGGMLGGNRISGHHDNLIAGIIAHDGLLGRSKCAHKKQKRKAKKILHIYNLSSAHSSERDTFDEIALREEEQHDDRQNYKRGSSHQKSRFAAVLLLI